MTSLVGAVYTAEERASSASAQASALEFLRTNHPELFVVSHRSPGIQCMNTRFGVDVTEDNLLSVILRPHAKKICDSLAPLSPLASLSRKEHPGTLMGNIIKDALNMLDIDIDDLKRIGVVRGGDSGWTEETWIHSYISYLRGILGNLYKLKTRAQKAAERAAKAEDDRRMMESIAASRVRSEEMAAARREEARRNSEYQRILKAERNAAARATRNAKLAAHGKIPAEVDLLGLDSAEANSERRTKEYRNTLRDILNGERKATLTAHRKIPVAEGDLLGLHPAAANSERRTKEIAKDLEGLFSGGRRHKSRKARKSRKSRKHSRK